MALHEFLIHFEAKVPWCAILVTNSIENVTIIQILQAAVARYNIAQHTSLSLADSKVFSTDQSDRTIVEEEDLEQNVTQECKEYILQFPSAPVYPQNEAPKIDPRIASNLSSLCVKLLRSHQIGDVRLLLHYITGGPNMSMQLIKAITEKIENFTYPFDPTILEPPEEKVHANFMMPEIEKQSFHDQNPFTSAISRSLQSLYNFDWVFSSQMEILDVLDEPLSIFPLPSFPHAEDQSTNSLLLGLTHYDPNYKNIISSSIEISKTNPQLAIKTILSHTECFGIIPKIVKEQKELDIFLDEAKNFGFSASLHILFAEIFERANLSRFADKIICSIPGALREGPPEIRPFAFLLYNYNEMAKFASLVADCLSDFSEKSIGPLKISDLSEIFISALNRQTANIKTAQTAQTSQISDEGSEDIDLLGIVLMAATYLFTGKYFDAFARFANIVLPFQQFMASSKRIKREWTLYMFSYSAFKKMKPGVQTKSSIAAIGDQSLLQFGYRSVPYYGQITPMPIYGLRCFNFIEGWREFPAGGFRSRLDELSKYEAVILVIGSNDLSKTFRELLQNGIVDNTSAAFGYIFTAFQIVIGLISDAAPNCKIYMHPVIAPNHSFVEAANVMNMLIMTCLESKAIVLPFKEPRRAAKIDQNYLQSAEDEIIDFEKAFAKAGSQDVKKDPQ